VPVRNKFRFKVRAIISEELPFMNAFLQLAQASWQYRFRVIHQRFGVMRYNP
jgi:hypothetical protein